MSDATQHNPATVHDTDQTAHPASDTAHPASTGPTYWRSLDELADTPEFRRYLDSEFPGYDPQTILSGTRRSFLKIMGASFALAGLVGCRRWPQRELAPYTARPEDRMPGVPERYATAFERDGVARPLLVTAFDGRPIKIEGNPDHPASGGAADVISQASILDLYDPHRLRRPRRKLDGRDSSTRTWSDVQDAMRTIADEADENDGEGLVVLSELSSSPTMARLREALLRRWPKAQWGVDAAQPGDAGAIYAAEGAFGRRLRTHYHLADAQTIVAVDSDFLMTHPDAIRLAREYGQSRRGVDDPAGRRMSRFLAVETTMTVTGANADQRVAVPYHGIGPFVQDVAAELGVGGLSHTDQPHPFAKTVAQSLRDAGARGVLIVGLSQPHDVQALGHAINHHLANTGTTVSYTEAEFPEFAESLPANTTTAIILGGNPAYSGDRTMQASLANTPRKVHLTDAPNETSEQCEWVLPRTHYLEAWGDARAFDGTVCIAQPLIEPLFGARSDIQVIAMLLGEKIDGLEHVRRTHGMTADRWRKSLHDGLVADSAAAPLRPTSARAGNVNPVDDPGGGRFEVTLRCDYKLVNGQHANNGWLQELPDPITKLAWDNAAYISPADADELGVKLGDVVRLTDKVSDRAIDVPVYPLPGQPRRSIALTRGYGRTVCGPVGRNVGFDVGPLLSTGGGVQLSEVTVSPTGKTDELVTTQDHFAIDPVGAKAREDRVEHELIRSATLDHYRHNPDFVHAHRHSIPLPVYGQRPEGHEHAAGEGHDADHHHQPHAGPEHPDGYATARGPQPFENPLDRDGSDTYQWGMAIDLNSCIGCNACVIACQAENNIPIVGKSQVKMNREMHWIRIDRYFTGDPHDADSVQAAHQPLMCVHCENAPCEQVCPVSATVHDSEGLNVMVYNRCIGTRYCANNCPYKVRRFNYADWHARDPRNEGNTPPFLGMPDQEQLEEVGEIERMQFNPEVTVRMRGVMEKCTYCVQRIQQAKQQAKTDYGQDRRESPTVGGDEIQTACQQTCPTQAIHFGNLRDPNSTVARLQYENKRSYSILNDLNTRPRTQYLAKITNPARGNGKGGHGSEHA